jgi:methylmalonyl-CoA mutase
MRAVAHIEEPVSSGRPIRVVTAAALFDGHDAAIHIVRRILQAQGAEVVHLGHDRSVAEIVKTAIEEDAQAVAVSSYQGGHMELFRYLIDSLREAGAGHVQVFGGGGGTILQEEIDALHAYGVARVFSPQDGKRLGLVGMIKSVLRAAGEPAVPELGDALRALSPEHPRAVAQLISWLERAGEREPRVLEPVREELRARAMSGGRKRGFVLGITGTGGAGKSSVLDELLLRLMQDAPGLRVGLLLVDPTRRRSGGALLGDRIRINALSLYPERLYARSLATRQANASLSSTVKDAALALRAAGYDLVIVETAGIGQADSAITDLVDASVYVMTPEYGAPSQLEKIDMLELADIVVLNKVDRQGGYDALRDVRKQWKRNHERFDVPDAQVPVYATIASRWDDHGMKRLHDAILSMLARAGVGALDRPTPMVSVWPAADAPQEHAIVPAARVRYLSEIAEAVREYHACTEDLVKTARVADAMRTALLELGDAPRELDEENASSRDTSPSFAVSELRERYRAATDKLDELDPKARQALALWPHLRHRYEAETQHAERRGSDQVIANYAHTLAGTRVPRVALPRDESWSELLRFVREENVPGSFPFTAGVFAFRSDGEDPTRMFAGEGGPERTNRRFHMLAKGQSAVRLSTAFDSVTLYGRDPDRRPDIYGKVGTSGVSMCTLDDAKILYSGFDLGAASTSVSMTINGPAPIVLACFFNAAIDQAVEMHLRAHGKLDAVRAAHGGSKLPSYEGALPEGHDGRGLGLLGISGADAVEPEVYARIARDVLERVRGTVQADILKEDQAQNTCIFATEFALRAMADMQAYFVAEKVKSFYSVSVSGYHIAEAGGSPITQLAFTLANAFTYVEHYRARGLSVDDFASSFSFFFSHGLEAEHNVLGRVARRIWAIAMRDVYGAGERSQKLKYHVQTSGRSLHAQEMTYNDIRTTLQALAALLDRCNSLHTNAFDEAVTTPTESSVRTAIAIQLIAQKELGLMLNENALQGSYAIEQLTAAVERAVLEELDRLTERGGVLGGMEKQYQRGKIQEESLLYETKKHSGELPIIGVNTFVREVPEQAATLQDAVRASDTEKDARLAALAAFHARHAAHAESALGRLQEVARSGGNVFTELMRTVRHASLGQITETLFQVGGRYRRAM